MIENNSNLKLENLIASAMSLQELAAHLNVSNANEEMNLNCTEIRNDFLKSDKDKDFETGVDDKQIRIDFSSALDREIFRLLLTCAKQRCASEKSYIWIKHAVVALNHAIEEGHICIPISKMAALSNTSESQIIEYLKLSQLLYEIKSLPVNQANPANQANQSQNSETTQNILKREINLALPYPFILDRERNLYWARDYHIEMRLAYALSQLLQPTSNIASDGINLSRFIKEKGKAFFEQIFPKDFNHQEITAKKSSIDIDQKKSKYNELNQFHINWQKVAAALATHSRLLVISGGPGTGKTTTVAAILACLIALQDNLKIALAAPTGKAAQRMQNALMQQISHWPAIMQAKLNQVLSSPASTVHRLIGKQRGQRSKFNRHQPLPYDVVIIDEASMLDQHLSYELIEALHHQARLVLLGDKDQLSAVEAGAVFADLSEDNFIRSTTWNKLFDLLGMQNNFSIDSTQLANNFSLADCCVWLQKNYRFSETSTLGQFANAIRNGDIAAAWSYSMRIEIKQTSEKNEGKNRENVFSTGEKYKNKTDLLKEEVQIVMDGGITLNHFSLQTIYVNWQKYINALVNFLLVGAKSSIIEYVDMIKQLFDSFNFYRILCATRLGSRGVIAINKIMAQFIRQQLVVQLNKHKMSVKTMACYFSSDDNFFIGQPLMVNCNDYSLNLFNGDIGIVVPDFSLCDQSMPNWKAVFQTSFQNSLQNPNEKNDVTVLNQAQLATNPVRQFPLNILPTCETAFAMTIHKSQGSEFNQVGVVLPNDDLSDSTKNLVTRELLYTGITRACQSVVIYSGEKVIEYAISTPKIRRSCLRKRLIKMINSV